MSPNNCTTNNWNYTSRTDAIRTFHIILKFQNMILQIRVSMYRYLDSACRDLKTKSQ